MVDWSVVRVSDHIAVCSPPLTLSAADQQSKPPLSPMISNTPSLRLQCNPEIQAIPAKRIVVTLKTARLGSNAQGLYKQHQNGTMNHSSPQVHLQIPQSSL